MKPQPSASRSAFGIPLPVWMAAFACLGVGPMRLVASQDMHSGHAGTMRIEIPPEQLPPPKELTGIGNAALPITANAEAQKWFNQGLNLYHDFWDYEAARAFQQSIRVDPDCAMCYWGLYQAESNYHSTIKDFATAALQTAMRLESHASEGEKLYIEASVAHESAMKTMQRTAPQEISILRQLVAKYPSDTQARIFLANALPDGYDAKGEPNPGQRESLDLLQGILKDQPLDSSANHYWIHALEGLHPEQALASAKLVATLAPTSGHMVHMPGHIYYRLGDYADAESSFKASMEVDERYMREQHVSVDEDWNYVHNLMYAVANLLEEGKIKDAEQLSGKLTAARGDLPSTMYVFSARDSIARLDSRLPVALRTAAWTEAIGFLNASKDPLQQNLRFLKRALVAVTTGMDALQHRDIGVANESIRRLDAELWEASERLKTTPPFAAGRIAGDEQGAPQLEVRPDALAQPLISFLAIMSLEMRGAVSLINNESDAGKQLFEAAKREERQLGYREPPHYIRPVGEAEGAALLAVNDWTSAKAAYEDALQERPHSGFPLFGIAKSREGAGEVAAAVAAYRAFLAAWKNADSGRSEVRHAAAYISEHAGQSASP